MPSIPKKIHTITSVILAGGKNSRYQGKNKAFLELEGESFYDRTRLELTKIFHNVILITNKPELFPDTNCVKYTDIIQNIGPLGGIHAALAHEQHQEAVFVAAVDMPFINETIISKIVARYFEQQPDILIPRINTYIEPLLAIYKTSVFGKLDIFLKNTKSYAIRDFFKEVDVKYIDFDDDTAITKGFVNINTPKEFEMIQNQK